MSKWLAPLLISVVFASLSLSFLLSAAPTFDESVFLPAGYTYLRWNDYRIDPEHPPLVKKLGALPAFIRGVWPRKVEAGPEDFTGSTFFDSGRLLRLSWAIALKYPNSQWNFCHQFLYGPTEAAQRRLGIDSPLLIPTNGILKAQDFHTEVDPILFRGRLIMLCFGVGLVLLVYLWSNKLHGGVASGCLAMALLAFDPSFIAHSSLIATDVPVTCLITGAIYSYWRLSQRFETRFALSFLLFFALAFATKFSAVLLLPVFGLLAPLRIIDPSPWPVGRVSNQFSIESKKSKAGLLLVTFIFACLATYFAIWSFYGFRYSAAADPQEAALNEKRAIGATSDQSVTFRRPGFLPIEDDVRRSAAIKVLLPSWPNGDIPESSIDESMKTTPIGGVDRLLLFANDHQLLPESYLAGFARTEVISLTHPSYLRGQYSPIGFKSYFFWTAALKTPLLSILAVITGLYLAIAQRMSFRRDLAFLVVPVGLYGLLVVSSHLNIGHRHLLPIYPFLYVLAGGMGKRLTIFSKTRQRWLAMTGVGLIAISSCVVFYPPWRPQIVFPHFLAYFNELAGGPRNGWRSLVDSNIDWGQDLKELKSWQDRSHLEAPLYLSYFGTADPRYYQIVHKAIPKSLGGYPPTAHETDEMEAVQLFSDGLRPGDYIAVSIQNLIGPSLSAPAHDVWNRILLRSTLVDRIGYSIFIYQFDTKSP